MKKESRAWIEAGKILARDPEVKVRCPICGEEYLKVTDQPHGPESNHFDRYMRCPRCGATEVLVRLTK